MRGESNLFFTLAQWKDNKLTIAQPERMTLISRRWYSSMTSAVLLAAARRAGNPQNIRRDWLMKPDFYEIDTSNRTSMAAMGNNAGTAATARAGQ